MATRNSDGTVTLATKGAVGRVAKPVGFGGDGHTPRTAVTPPARGSKVRGKPGQTITPRSVRNK
jgi:hypothetical protein